MTIGEFLAAIFGTKTSGGIQTLPQGPNGMQRSPGIPTGGKADAGGLSDHLVLGPSVTPKFGKAGGPVLNGTGFGHPIKHAENQNTANQPVTIHATRPNTGRKGG